MADGKKNPGQLIFGLDIGTRSIVGTVGYRTEDDTFHVIAQCMKEHETRAMLDGQIHDIEKVGKIIFDVKEVLEKQIGKPLNEVCIAAAGRVLKTVTTQALYELPEEMVINAEHVYTLEMLGLEKAYEEFQEQNNTELKFYCVGYTVVRYFLNNYPIGVLEHHKAKQISVELIATFLPDEVVDGLYRAVETADLQVANLTLEPIAAMQAAVPTTYRTLNIALVDVGAGTSDISITRDGSIIAYGMIPSAGDELTEAVSQHCLVDFTQAEKIKLASGRKAVIKYKDIMGVSHKIMPEEVLKTVDGVIKSTTKEIAEKIKELNGGKPVSAVFVVGGGGKIPGFTNGIAKELGISRERVALRGEEVLGGIDYQIENAKRDSLFVTPIGICLNFYEQKNNFIFVNFNGKRVKLYDNGHLMIADAAMQAGFPNEGLFPKRGKELNFTVNEKPYMVRGEPGETATVLLNGEGVSINAPIQAGDKIRVKESTAGRAAELEIKQLPEYDSTISVIVNEKKVVLPKFAEVNGTLQSEYYSIREKDAVRMLSYYTVRQIAEFMDVLLKKDMNIYVNNKLADLDTKVYENFGVIWTMEELALSDVDKEDAGENYISGEDEKKKGRESKKEVKKPEAVPPAPEKEIDVIANGRPVHMSGKKSYIFVDIFDYIEFDLSKPQGAAVVTELNGRKAQYTEYLSQGDQLKIYWI
ncbi:MAG: cell division FtsA domain-containing protein [Lachnospiraceae bacterium]